MADNFRIELVTPSARSAPTLRKRLWQAGIAVALFVGTIAIGNLFVASDKAVSRKSAGHDFLAFYTAGTFVRTGRSAELYDLDAVKAFEQELARREGLELSADTLGPYWNPPFFAWVFVPLSTLSYMNAWTVWCCFNLACFAGAMVILCRMLETSDWRNWALVPLLTMASLPFVQSLGHGQNTCLSLLLLSATIALWRSNRGVAAGVVCGLLFYKPQLGAILAAALVVSEGWRPLCGLAITGVTLLATTLITLPGTLGEFLHKLPANVVFMQVERRYLWERHATLKAFWRLMMQGYEVGEMTWLTNGLYIATALALGVGFFVMIWRHRSGTPLALCPGVGKRDRVIAATVVSMPLLMPFYFDYDLLLLSASAVLIARMHLHGEAVVSRSVTWTWVALFGWMMVNPSIAGATHVNGTVILLAVLSVLLIRQTMRKTQVTAAVTPVISNLRQAA